MQIGMAALAFSSLIFLVFSELSASCFRRLTPLLEAWSNERTKTGNIDSDDRVGWERLALVSWAIAISIPLLSFTVSAYFFANSKLQASDFITGTLVGSNVIALAIGFAFIQLSGPIKFFRIRSINSPLFLLLATLVFVVCSLNARITIFEGGLLLAIALAYVMYFRRFSTEARYQQRMMRKRASELEPNLLAVLAVACMGIGFFGFAIIACYPLLSFIQTLRFANATGYGVFAIHFVAVFLSLPWMTRILLSLFTSSTRRAFLVTNLTHACLFNLLILPGVMALLMPLSVNSGFIQYDMPFLLIVTVVFVCTLLIEKERSKYFPWVLLGSYLVYSAIGLVL